MSKRLHVQFTSSHWHTEKLHWSGLRKFIEGCMLLTMQDESDNPGFESSYTHTQRKLLDFAKTEECAFISVFKPVKTSCRKCKWSASEMVRGKEPVDERWRKIWVTACWLLQVAVGSVGVNWIPLLNPLCGVLEGSARVSSDVWPPFMALAVTTHAPQLTE